MIQAKDLYGVGVAVVTPFTKVGEVDFEALENLVDYLIKGGVDYLVALGTTAETATLSVVEQEAVANCIFAKTAGRVPLVIGAGGNCTQAVLEKLDNPVFTQYDALLIATPYYNKPNQAGLVAHYSAIAEKTAQPIILYNVPGRTGVNMSVATTLHLANRFENVIAVKEASGDLLQINTIVNEKPQHFEVISGDDALTLPMLSVGVVGVISVLANALPNPMATMVHSALRGDYAKAQQEHKQLFDLAQAIFKEGNPTGIKALMAQQGLLENVLRLPLVSATEKLFEELRGLY